MMRIAARPKMVPRVAPSTVSVLLELSPGGGRRPGAFVEEAEDVGGDIDDAEPDVLVGKVADEPMLDTTRGV
jgi:hypothetical protein